MRLRNRSRVTGMRRIVESVVPPVTAIATNGWQVTYLSPPTEFDPAGSPVTFNASRAGYTTSGSTTTYTEAMTITKRVRQPFPNQATLTTDQAALNDFLYSTDSVSGATNNSTETSPVPICQWGVSTRRVVGNSLYLEVVAFHFNARAREQVACVEFTATDGVTTVTSIVSASSISARGWDMNPVIVHATTLDITSLNAGNITANAKVYPWIGASGSIANSAAGTENARGFSPLLFVKNTSLASTPPLVYVSTTGVDATVDVNGQAAGITKVSTTAATAKANPFATLASAVNALKAATNLTGGFTDGCEVRFMSGSHTVSGSPLAGTYTSNCGVVITRDPDVAFADVTVSFGAAWNSRHARVDFRGLQIARTANVSLFSVTGSNTGISFTSCSINGGSFTASAISTATYVEYVRCDFLSCPSGVFGAGTAEGRRFRGCTSDVATIVEAWSVIGCRFQQDCDLSHGARTPNRSIIAYNEFYRVTGVVLEVNQSSQITNFAVSQNVFEFISATSNPVLRLSGDNAPFGMTHCVFVHNTMAGFYTNGRCNFWYNDSAPTSNRTQKLIKDVGNIYVQRNTKHDIFAGLNDGYADAGSRIGGWSNLFGVGSQGNFVQFTDAVNSVPGPQSSFSQEYGGIGSVFGTSSTVRLDPLFVDYKGTTSGPLAGSGGGNYRLSSGSPADNRVAPVLRFDLDGNARSASLATSGAYEL